MTVRLRILIGCLLLTGLTGLVGLVASRAERQLTRLSLEVYDQAFMGMSYLRAAQVDFATSRLGGSLHPSATADSDLLQDLAVARERALSTHGRAAVARLQDEIGELRQIGSTPALDARVAEDFDTAVELFAGDGFHLRRTTSAELSAHLQRNNRMLGVSVLFALLITALVTRAIVAPLREAVRIAKSVASGKLDNDIPVRGSGETGDLLRALAAMQSSIGTAMARIQALVAEQAASHAGEIALHHARMHAALDNMVQGLCLFDRDGRLAVVNRRFGEMFGPIEIGSDGLAVAKRSGQTTTLDTQLIGKRISYDTADGRAFSVSLQPVQGGGAVCTYTDVSEQRAFENQLFHMARHDPLTGLPNRVAYAEFVLAARERIGAGCRVSVLCLGLDGLRLVNGALGQQAGDVLLRLIAERIRQNVDEPGLVARLGDHVFAVVLEGVEHEAVARDVAERLIGGISAGFVIGGQSAEVGTSIGIASSDNAHIAADTLLSQADIALHVAIAAGRGTIRLFDDSMDASMRKRRKMEIDLRRALERGEFELFYQPLLSIGGGVCGFESLLRWHHPTDGMVPPGMFIPVAEELGLIAPIGRWVLHQACRDAVTWPANLRVAVNVSPVQFANVLLVDEIASALQASGLAPARLDVEITESVLMSDEGRILQTLNAIRAMGAKISMDDFGTGYSSLSYLRRFPFDKIKIDRSFVTGLTRSGDGVAIVRAIISLGKSLGMRINAEGIENEEQREVLAREGVDELQGYLIGRPGPVAQIAGLLAQHGLTQTRANPVERREAALV